MAKLRLRRRELEIDGLPQSCMACGQAAATTVRKTFAVSPSWAGIVGLVVFLFSGLPGIVVFVVVIESLKKRITIDVPLCERHRGYFTKRNVWKFLLVGLCFVLPVVAGTIAYALTETNEPTVWVLFVILSFVLSVIAAAVAISTIENNSIRCKEIDGRSVTLVRVHDDFIATAAAAKETWDADVDEELMQRRMIRMESRGSEHAEPSEGIRAERPQRMTNGD